MDRKLASIQKVEAIRPIENADKIEQIDVMGWSLVARKGEFQPGTLCVFFEIDAILSKDAPWAQFLKDRGYRVKTMRLRGTLSQGLALPLSILPDNHGLSLDIGSDVTELLGVTKFVIPEQNSLDIAGPFIPRVPKTDEIRIQSMLGMIDALRGKPYYITEKVDGTSCTVGKTGDKVYVCSRNGEIKPGINWYWSAALRYRLDQLVMPDTAIQGEVCGPGIQKNRLNLTETQIRIFDIWDIRGGEYWKWDAVKEFCAQDEIPTVREIERGEAFDYCLEDLLKLADGQYPGTKNRREGIVIRPLFPVRMPTGDRLSFKALSNEYLLKEEE